MQTLLGFLKSSKEEDRWFVRIVAGVLAVAMVGATTVHIIKPMMTPKVERR